MNSIHGAAKKAVQRINTSVFGSSKSGLTILEVAVVIMVIAVLSGIAMTQFRGVGQSPMDQVIEDFGGIAKRTQLAAMRTNLTHRIVFDFHDRSIYAQRAQQKLGPGGELEFEAMPAHEQIQMPIPQNIDVTGFFVDGTDELAGGETNRAWIYVYPSGILQNTQITLQQTNTDAQETIAVNPFTGQVTSNVTA